LTSYNEWHVLKATIHILISITLNYPSKSSLLVLLSVFKFWENDLGSSKENHSPTIYDEKNLAGECMHETEVTIGE
jgi:hypothetical protein